LLENLRIKPDLTLCFYRFAVILRAFPFPRYFGINFCMFNNQFSQLESAIQRLVSENQQLNQALLQSQQQLQQKHEELENFQLQAMEQEELQTATAQKLEALLALFPAQV
jgi:hypothetical protein